MKMMRYSMNSIVLVGLLLVGAVQAEAVEYKSTYKGSQRGIQTTTMMERGVQTAAPSAVFQSTSAFSGQLQEVSTTPMLNTDGTVNADAYGVGQTSASGRPGHIRRDPNNPVIDDEEEDPGNPVGDGLWALLLMAGAYVAVRTARRRAHS